MLGPNYPVLWYNEISGQLWYGNTRMYQTYRRPYVLLLQESIICFLWIYIQIENIQFYKNCCWKNTDCSNWKSREKTLTETTKEYRDILNIHSQLNEVNIVMPHAQLDSDIRAAYLLFNHLWIFTKPCRASSTSIHSSPKLQWIPLPFGLHCLGKFHREKWRKQEKQACSGHDCMW